jgi:hypothetical protein
MTRKTQSKPRTAAASKDAPAPKSRSTAKSVAAPKTVSAPKTRSTRTKAIATEPMPAAPRTRARTRVRASSHPQEIPNIEVEPDVMRAADQPFEEGAHDMIDADLRHRMISEAAYRHYAERGYEDGYDLDDWLQAEAEVDHLLINPPPE